MNKIIYNINAIGQGARIDNEEKSIECPDTIIDVDEADEYLQTQMEYIMEENNYDMVLDFKVLSVGPNEMTTDEQLKLNVQSKQDSYDIPDLYTPAYYDFLAGEAWILGCITPNDEILSVIVHFEEAQMHGDYFPNLLSARRWRWSWNGSLDDSVLGNALTKEDWERVRDYLTRKYDIQWMENGYHDIEYIQKKIKGE